jgi:L-rhamnose mutarotase
VSSVVEAEVDELRRPLKRYAFLLRIREGTEAAYEKAHREVWPEMLQLLSESGVREYSIFRRGQLLFLTLKTFDFNETWDRIEASPINTRWQESMAPYFLPLDPLWPGERLPMMEEIFYMP